MNGRQVSLAGHRFLAVVDPRIRGMDYGDAARICGHGTSATGMRPDGKRTARVVPVEVSPRPPGGTARPSGRVPQAVQNACGLETSSESEGGLTYRFH